MAKVYLDTNESYRLLDDATVFGTTFGTESLIIMGYPDIQMDANIERVEFTGSLSDYTFQVSGSAISIFSSGQPVAGFTSLNNNVTLAFADGSAALSLTGLGSASLGGQALSTQTGGTSLNATLDTSDVSSVGDYVPGSTTVNVTEANTTPYDASTGDFTFNFTQGNYEYSIDGFGPGDVLNVLDTAAMNVTNTLSTDGIIDVQAADNVTTTTVDIHLTGVSSTQDANIFNVSSFNSVFGDGSLA